VSDVIWTQTVDDGAFTAEVTRVDDDYGTLRVSVTGGEQLLERPVSLAYGAPFGPDVDDVADWQDWTLEVIDAHLAKEEET
jgi:hypothetical protein